MNTKKYIENIKSKVEKQIEKLRYEANEAYRNWTDTGYQRYMNQKDRLEAQADELELFIKPELDIQAAWRKAATEEAKKEELKLLLKNMCNAIDMLVEDFPDCHATRRLENLKYRFKSEYANK